MQIYITYYGKSRRGNNRTNQSRRGNFQLFGSRKAEPGHGNQNQPGKPRIIPHRRQQSLRNNCSTQKVDYQKRNGNDYPEQTDGLLHNHYIGIHPGIFVRQQHHLVQPAGQHAHNAAQQIGKSMFISKPGHHQRYADGHK